MLRWLLLCVVFESLLFSTSPVYSQHHSSGSHSSHSHSSKSKDSSKETVHVHGYYRKDGTYVAPYDRAAPGKANSKTTPNTIAPAIRSYKRDYAAEGVFLHPSVQRDKQGRIKRSKSAKAAFERHSPCPSTGKNGGRCPGYVVDHIVPLECGGADAPSNMQWQTAADAKAKDKTERTCRL